MRPNTAIRRSFLLALAISSLMAAVLETTIQPGGQLRTHSLKAAAAQEESPDLRCQLSRKELPRRGVHLIACSQPGGEDTYDDPKTISKARVREPLGLSDTKRHILFRFLPRRDVRVLL